MRVVTLVLLLSGLIAGCFASAAAQDDGVFVAGAQRQFAAVTMPEAGSIYLQFTVHVLPSAAQAEAQFPDAVARLRDYFARVGSGAVTLNPANAGTIGDQAQAFTGTVMVQGVEARMAVIAWREGPLVYTAASAGFSGDQLAELKPIIARLADRQYADAPVGTDPVTGMHTGGAWDLLPDLRDIPEGFALDREVPLNPVRVATPTS